MVQELEHVGIRPTRLSLNPIRYPDDGGPMCEVKLPKEIIDEIIVIMNHARIFITSREKMHPTGIDLYYNLLSKLEELASTQDNHPSGLPLRWLVFP